MRVRIVGVQRFEINGKWYAYWRRKGAPRVPIDPTLRGAELAAQIARLEKKHLAPKARAGTLRGLIAEYKANADHWRDLRDRTRKDYERVFAWLGPALDLETTAFTSPEIAALRDKARDQHEPKFANQVVTTLKMVFRYGREHGVVNENPCTGLSKATGGGKRPNKPWYPREVIAALDAAPIGLRAALAMAAYCGIREGDVCVMSKAARNGDWLSFIQGKTRRPHEAFISEPLAKILATIPAHDSVTIVVSSKMTPWSDEGLKTAWDRLRADLVEAGAMRPGLTFHGLRHTGATILEEAGYEEAQTKHFLGHGPKTVSGHYGKSASRRKIVEEMSLVIAEAYQRARGNVVRIANGNVKK
jgi:integrase